MFQSKKKRDTLRYPRTKTAVHLVQRPPIKNLIIPYYEEKPFSPFIRRGQTFMFGYWFATSLAACLSYALSQLQPCRDLGYKPSDSS